MTSAGSQTDRTPVGVEHAMWVSVAELGLIALLTVRRTQLPWWQQALTVPALVGVGALVVAIKTLAH